MITSENNSFIRYTFKRSEYKYVLNKEQYEKLLVAIKSHVVADEHPQYECCNVYFDTDDNYLINRSLQQPAYKEKLRLRTYGIPNKDSVAFVEIKKKVNKIVYKRRITLKYQEAIDYLVNKKKPNIAPTQVFKEIDYFVEHYGCYPKQIVSYQREAYTGKAENDLRITFDTKIQGRNYDVDLSHGDHGDSLLADGLYLLEIKGMDALPIWLVRALSNLKIYKHTFSKYGGFYRLSNNQFCLKGNEAVLSDLKINESQRNEKCFQV